MADNHKMSESMFAINEMRIRLLFPGLITLLMLTGMLSDIIGSMGLSSYQDPITAAAIAMAITPLIAELFD